MAVLPSMALATAAYHRFLPVPNRVEIAAAVAVDDAKPVAQNASAEADYKLLEVRLQMMAVGSE